MWYNVVEHDCVEIQSGLTMSRILCKESLQIGLVKNFKELSKISKEICLMTTSKQGQC